MTTPVVQQKTSIDSNSERSEDNSSNAARHSITSFSPFLAAVSKSGISVRSSTDGTRKELPTQVIEANRFRRPSNLSERASVAFEVSRWDSSGPAPMPPSSFFPCYPRTCLRRVVSASLQHAYENEAKEECLSKFWLFPLRFKNNDTEQQFRIRMLESYPCRLIFAGMIWLIVLLISWIGIGIRLELFDLNVIKFSRVVNDSFPFLQLYTLHSAEKIIFHILLMLLCVLTVGLMIAPYILWCRPRLDFIVLWYIVIEEIMVFSWTLFVFIMIRKRRQDFFFYFPASSLTILQTYKCWTTLFALLLRIGEVSFATVVFPTRTNNVFYFSLYLIFNNCLTLISSNLLIHTYPDNALLNNVACLILICLTVLSFLGRYVMELHDRLRIYQLSERTRMIENTLRRSRFTSASGNDKLTVLEAILDNLERSKHLIDASHPTDIEHALSLIEQSITLLSQTNKFFAPNVAFPVGLDAVREFVLGRAPDQCVRASGGPSFTEAWRLSSIATVVPVVRSISRASHDSSPSQEESGNSYNVKNYPSKSSRFSDPTTPRGMRFLTPADSSIGPTRLSSGWKSGQWKRAASYTPISSDKEMNLLFPGRILTPVPEKLPLRITQQIGAEVNLLLQAVGAQWEFDALQLGNLHGMALVPVGSILLHTVTTTCLSWTATETFLQKLNNLYQLNPYHNSSHACMVAHAVMCFSRCLGLWNFWGVVEIAALIVAALGHDVGHRGRSNSFYSATVDSLVIMYNELSPLENLHACITMQLLQQNNSNIFGTFSEQFMTSSFRRHVTEFILVTDMKQHFDTLSRLRVRKASPEFDFLNCCDDFVLIGKLCMKAADLSHTAVTWDKHLDWSLRVCEEFYQQGDEERRLGLPLSPLCDRSLHGELAKSQKGFIDFVAMPLYEEIQLLAFDANANNPYYNICEYCCEQMKKNSESWEKIGLNPPDVPQEYNHFKTNQCPVFDTFVEVFEETLRESYHRYMLSRSVSDTLGIISGGFSNLPIAPFPLSQTTSGESFSSLSDNDTKLPQFKNSDRHIGRKTKLNVPKRPPDAKRNISPATHGKSHHLSIIRPFGRSTNTTSKKN